MSEKKAVIIGSGLGGLSTGVILSRNGFDVTVLEQHSQVGGCLQCFYRGKAKFETGMHFIGSAAPGQTLDRLLRFLDVRKDITLQPLDADGYDVVALGNELFRFANGRHAFISQLAQRFPHQRTQLEQYFNLIETVAATSALHNISNDNWDAVMNAKYQTESIDQTIDSIITDPLLARVLVGNLPLYAAEAGRTPFATHAFITDFYNRSAYRVMGGSDAIAASLVGTIVRHGGSVLTSRKVSRIVTDDTKATGVTTTDGQFFPADIVISDAHPIRTLELIDSKLIRPAYRNRIVRMPQTVGCFALYLHFKEGQVPYMNHNFYGYRDATPWGCEHYTDDTWPKGYLYMHMSNEPGQRYARSGVVLSYMQMADVDRWRNTTVGHRGSDYELFKQQKAHLLLQALEHHFQGISAKVQACYTSTPLTYLNYTGTADGSMYGVARDVTRAEACRVSCRLRIPNVLQTGQNINSHGILGTLVGTIITCGELIGIDTLFKQIDEA